MFDTGDEKTGVRDEFDAKADIYDSYRLAGWYHAHNDAILGHLDLGAGDTLLDVGCGTGYLMRKALCRTAGASAIGVDLSPRMADAARRKLAQDVAGRAQVFCDDWEAPGAELIAALGQDRISHVACASVLHYFASPVSALRRMHDVMAPGGALILLERSLERSVITRMWDLAHKHILRDHVRFYDTEGLLTMIAEAGFARAEPVETIRKFFWHNKMSTSISIIRAFK